jgi:hypothetical protein
MNPNKLKYAPLIVTYDDKSLALPLWTIVAIKEYKQGGAFIATSTGANQDSWIVQETFDTVMARYLELIRAA